MENADVSVIIPVHNGEKYLERCIESILNQSYKNIELLIIDDNSTDASYDVIAKYVKFSNVRFIKNSETLGPAKTRNIGLQNVASPYILFLDCDDWIDLNCIEKAMRILNTNSSVDIAIWEIKTAYYSNHFSIRYQYQYNNILDNKMALGLLSHSYENEYFIRDDEMSVIEAVFEMLLNYMIYGYILLIEVILNLLIALIIGLFSGEIWNILFFLCTYIPLRSFCGGWHAAKLWKCTVISSIIILVQVYVIKEILRYVSLILLFLYFLLNMLLVFLIAPVDTKAKRISNDERRIYKAKINWILMVHLIIAVLMAKFEFREFLLSIMYVYTIQSVMLRLKMLVLHLMYM